MDIGHYSGTKDLNPEIKARLQELVLESIAFELSKQEEEIFEHELIHGSPPMGIIPLTDEMALESKGKPHLSQLGFNRGV